jgi:hypothetical protein
MKSLPPRGGNRETIPVLLALILAALAALAGDTNVIYIDALPAGGKIYTNATITRVTPAYAVVSYQDGLVQIPMSNMPAVYQAQFGYTPEKAAQFLDEQRRIQQKQRQAFLAWQAATRIPTGTNQPVRITAIVDENSNGGIPFCSADGITGGLLVKNLPDSVRQFLARYRQLQADIADCQHQLDNLKVPPARTNTAPQPHMGKTGATRNNATGVYYLLPAPKPNDPAAAWRNARQDAEDRLNALNAELDEKTTNYDRYATIMARPTGESFGRKPIWISTAPPAAAAR